MTTNTNTQVVQVAGLHFQLSRLRAKRGLRGLASLIDLLGASAVSIITGKGANGITTSMIVEAAKKEGDPTGLTKLGRKLVGSAILGGNMSKPDTVERVANELLAYDAGQGVQVSTDGENWLPVHGVDSLDSWEMIGYLEMLQLLQLVIEFQFFPTSAGSRTADATAPAGTTTPTGNSHGGANSGLPASAHSGLVAG